MKVRINSTQLGCALVDLGACFCLAFAIVAPDRKTMLATEALSLAGLMLGLFCLVHGLRFALLCRRLNRADGIRRDVAPPGPSLRQPPALGHVLRD
jgi:hypothetical protein